jgi:hypothetical protein
MTARFQDRHPSCRATAAAATWPDDLEPIEELSLAELPGWAEPHGLGEWPTLNEMSGSYLGVELDRIW